MGGSQSRIKARDVMLVIAKFWGDPLGTTYGIEGAP